MYLLYSLTFCSIFPVVGDKSVLEDGVLLGAGRVVGGDVSHLAVPPNEVGTLAVQREEGQLLVPLEDVPVWRETVAMGIVCSAVCFAENVHVILYLEMLCSIFQAQRDD